MSNIIESKLDASNRIMNLQTYILQEVIDSILSERMDKLWIQRLYEYGKKLESESKDSYKRKEREKYSEFVESVDELGGRDHAKKDLIDTTLAIQIIIYNQSTKKYFELGKKFTDYVRALGAGRNAIKHRLDTLFRNSNDDQITFYYSLCYLQLAELFSFVEYLQKNEQYSPSGKNEIVNVFFEKIKEIEDDIAKELGSALSYDNLRNDIISLNECEREYSQETRFFIREETTKIFNNPILAGKLLELFEKAVKIRIVDINYLYILQQCINNNEIEKYKVYFTDTSLQYFLTSISCALNYPEEDLNDYFDSLSGKISSIKNQRNRGFISDIEYIILTLVIMMDICDKYSSEITAVYDERLRRSSFDVFAYSDKQIREYTKSNNAYVDIPWETKDENNSNYIDNVIDDACSSIRICGEAGCGKSTAIEHLVYSYAQGTYNSEYIKIPVLVELFKITSNNGLYDEISNILGINKEIINNFLKYNELVLFLDGYDEIYDYEVKKSFSREIDEIRRNYPELLIVISDRYVNSDIPVLTDAVTFVFTPINNDSIRKLIDRKCDDEETSLYLLNSLEEDPGYFSIYNTPLKVIILIEIVKENGELPTDYIESYIHYLLRREKNDKKSINVDYIDGSLEALAVLEDNIPVMKAERQIGRFLQNMHYTNADSKEILRISEGMGIVSNHGGEISFSNEEFRNYYEIKGIIDEIEDILQ